MFEADLSALSAEATLSLADAIEVDANRAEATRLQVAAHWADLHGETSHVPGTQSLPGMERLVQVGGEGTPEVAEFAPAELGARWTMSPMSATRYLGDALDLRHRLPRLWELILAGRVQAWVGRKVAQATRAHPAAVAAHVDRRVSLWAPSKSWWQLEDIVAAAVIEADPVAAAEAVRQAELAQGVWVGQSSDNGVKDIYIRTEAANAIWFDAAVDRVADGLETLGDTDLKDVRRAKAVGVLAQPQQALDLFDAVASVACADHGGTGPDAVGAPWLGEAAAEADAVAADDAAGVGSPTSRRGDARPKAVLYIHLSQESFTRDAGGVARFEGVGPITVDQTRRWLGHCHVDVKPVIDLAGQVPVDAYEVPDRMREAVLLRNPVDVFPYATATSRSRDMDHTAEYVPPDDGGPPGQTRTDNLGPLSRRSHRIKTFGGWQAWQLSPGVFLWRAPHGDHYLVDHIGTHRVRAAAALPV